MDADIRILFSSDFYRIIDFRCKCLSGCKSKSEFSKSFNISFIRKGNFIYNVYRDSYDAFSGYAIIDKPGSEHIVEHCHHIPDECTIIDFTDEFYSLLKNEHKIAYKSFFTNIDAQSLFVKTNAEVEYLHYSILNHICNSGSSKLKIDMLVMDLLHWFLQRIDNKSIYPQLSSKLKSIHLITLEDAKDYMLKNLNQDISLNDIAFHCNLSLFHFSRIFKQLSNITPYQYLLNIRLTNASQLIKYTDLNLQEIGYLSGFNSAEHFNVAFKNKFKLSPSGYKAKK